jgi:DNA-binding transcriptional ArsR family regulator
MQPYGCLSMEEVFRALADPSRRLMLEELSERDEQTLYELCARMVMKHGVDVSRQAITKHLAILIGAGLVRSERRGKFKVLTLDRAPLRKAVRPWLDRLDGPPDGDDNHGNRRDKRVRG